MMKLAVLGINGMLGSAVYSVLKNTDFDVRGVTRKELDAEKATVDEIRNAVADSDYIINCIGIIKPYIHDDNSHEVERAVAVNALFPYKLAKTGIKIIQIATDCVYDGVKGNYIETDSHNALDVYGKTKSLGEVPAGNVLNLRCSIIGREKEHKKSLLEWFLNQMPNAQLKGYQNHLWNGISTIAFAKICKGIIENDFWFSGLQHIVPTDRISKAGMLKSFAMTFDRKDIRISDIDADVSINRTIMTVNTECNVKLWRMAGYESIPTITEIIAEIKHYD